MSDTHAIHSPDASDLIDGASLSDDELIDEMCSQAAHLAIAECHFVMLIAEFDRRELWGDGDCRSGAHWLNWRCGISLGTAREQVRVGRALEHLPATRAAFAAGELSYSKVRAITRVASAATEDELLGLARLATAAQLENIVREYRRADPDEGQRALDLHRERYLRSYTDRDGMLVIQARMSPEDGAMVLAAIEAARQAIRESRDPVDPDSDVSAETFMAATAADALTAVCEASLENGLDREAGDPKVSVILHLDEQVAADPSNEGCSYIEGVGAVSSHTAMRLACDASISKLLYLKDGSVEPEGKTHSIPRRIRRAILARDRGCRFPGCTQRKFVDVHHVVYWSRGGSTKPSNLVSLCRFHHRRVHEGGYEMSLSPVGALRVRKSDGTEIPFAPRPLRPHGAGIRERHGQAGLQVDQETLSYGCNDPLDLDMAVSSLLEGDYRRSSPGSSAMGGCRPT